MCASVKSFVTFLTSPGSPLNSKVHGTSSPPCKIVSRFCNGTINDASLAKKQRTGRRYSPRNMPNIVPYVDSDCVWILVVGLLSYTVAPHQS